MLQIRRVITLILDRHRAPVFAVLGSSSTPPSLCYLSPPQICFHAGAATRKSPYLCLAAAVDSRYHKQEAPGGPNQVVRRCTALVLTFWALTGRLQYTGQSILDTYDFTFAFTTHELRRHPTTKEPPRATFDYQRTLGFDCR